MVSQLFGGAHTYTVPITLYYITHPHKFNKCPLITVGVSTCDESTTSPACRSTPIKMTEKNCNSALTMLVLMTLITSSALGSLGRESAPGQ